MLFLLSPRVKQGTNFRAGSLAAVGVGLTASLGNLALLLSLRNGGEVSIVFPLTGLFPLGDDFSGDAGLARADELDPGRGHRDCAGGDLSVQCAGGGSDDERLADGGEQVDGICDCRVGAVGRGGGAAKDRHEIYLDGAIDGAFCLAFIPVAIVLSIIYPIEWHTTARRGGSRFCLGADRRWRVGIVRRLSRWQGVDRDGALFALSGA